MCCDIGKSGLETAWDGDGLAVAGIGKGMVLTEPDIAMVLVCKPRLPGRAKVPCWCREKRWLDVEELLHHHGHPCLHHLKW